jgi:hypothetical protein
MNLSRLINEIETLYRSEARFGVPAKLTVGALIIDYVYGFDFTEPSIPTYPAYVWPIG